MASAIGAATSVFAQDSVLATVNGTPIRRTEAMERAWREAGSIVINQMADEILVRQAADEAGVKVDPKQVDKRLKRIESTFKDEAAFREHMNERGMKLEALRSQVTEQVLRENLLIKAKDLSVTEAEAKTFFEANKAKLGAEAVRLRHIVVASKKEADDFSAAIRAGADFGRLASQVSIDAATKDRGGDLGFVVKGTSSPEIEAVILKLMKGEFSAPVKNGDSYHLFQAMELRPAKKIAFTEAKDDIMEGILASKVSKAWPEHINELRAKAKYVKGEQ